LPIKELIKECVYVLFPSEDTFPLIANVHKDGYFELLSSVRSVILVDIPLGRHFSQKTF